MSVLATLVNAYSRLRGAPPFGYSDEKISFVISLNDDGTPANVIDLRTGEGKKRTAPLMVVPQPAKRTVAIAPNFLWDKTSYALGVTAGEGGRLSEVHSAFVKLHTETLKGSDDPGLKSLFLFLRNWTPARFAELGWPEEMKDQNVVFALESERRQNIYVHDRPAARDLWTAKIADHNTAKAICLITGELGPIARLHPSIKGVWGAQSSGASIISFNLDAFESYGHKQGENAPVSEAAAFAYTTALNTFLQKGSKNRVQIGDSSTVFWADASDAEVAMTAEGIFGKLFSETDESSEAKKVAVILEHIRKGQPLKDFAPQLSQGVRFYVLGLAPNATRLSIRFWLENDFECLAENYQKFVSDMHIEPLPRDHFPPLWKYLAEAAVLGKRENVPPNLAGEWMRSILTGTRYPLTLLSTVLMRVRADKDVNALRAGMLKALLVRNFKMEVPVALDMKNANKGYLLGRLFAAYEHVQNVALGLKVNATIKDKFYGAASAQPRKVFALLEKSSANHLSKVGKQKPGYRINLEKTVGAIMEQLSPGDDPFPSSLSAQEQALFGLGYYHQRNSFFKSNSNETLNEEAT